MQFKFKHSKITFNTKPNLINGLNVTFVFAEGAKAAYDAITNNPQAILVEDLNKSSSLVIYDNSILVGLGAEDKFTSDVFVSVASNLAKFIASREISEINLHLTNIHANKLTLSYPDMVEKFLVDFGNGLYYFDEFKTDKHKLALTKVHVTSDEDLTRAIANAVAILDGYFIVRDLANNPSNVATPTYLGEVAESFAKINKNVAVEVLNEKEIKKLGMHAFLGVAKGSKEEPRFIN